LQGVILDEMRLFVARRYGYRTWLERWNGRRGARPSATSWTRSIRMQSSAFWPKTPPRS